MKDDPSINGHSFLFSELCGEGDPVLLISGLGYSSWCWKEVRERATKHHSVVTFDNRGTGRSAHPPGPYSIDMLADDAARVLHEHKLSGVHVVGHSMGGYIALTLAVRHPELVRSLVLIGTSPGGAGTKPVPEATQARWQQAVGLSAEDNIRATMPFTFSQGWSEANPGPFDEFVRRRLEYPTSLDGWLAQYEACIHYISEGVPVEGIKVPSLVIHGADDRVVPVDNGRILAERLPNSRYIELAGQGHLPYLEDPDGQTDLMLKHWQVANQEPI